MKVRWLSLVTLAGLMVMLISLWTSGAAASAELPPRPTVVPTPTRLPDPEPTGATLALHATFPQDWDFAAAHWQTPWTAMEWQDATGDWHTVDGWQGHFDHILPEGNRLFGLKTWWVAPEDMKTGPFRWVIYDRRGGHMLSISESFYLPGSSLRWKIIDAALVIP